MNIDVDEMLAARADALAPPHVDPKVVLARGEQLVARRRRRTTVLAACGLVLVAGVAALVAPGGGERVAPVQPSDPTRTTEPGARPLGFGQGQVLHLGPLRVDTGLDFVALDLTDDGAALVTLDGAVWFSDGTGVERLGTAAGATPMRGGGVSLEAGTPQEWVVSDSAGSLLAWVDHSREDATPELVVYDSRARRVVMSEPVPVPRPRDQSIVVGLAGSDVFVLQGQRGRVDRPPTWLRFSVDGGFPAEVDSESYDAATRATRRALVLGRTHEVLGVSDGMPRHVMELDAIEVREQRMSDVLDAGSGEAVEIELPGGDPVFEAVFWQWLDDDQFVVWANGDLVACQVSTGACRLVVDGNWVIGRKDAPLMPGDEGIGADWALARAMRAVGRAG